MIRLMKGLGLKVTVNLPSHADVVIIGGGVIGASVAYHLTKLGICDVVLLERKQLTSGTTWHAAGLVGQLRATHNMTRLAQYTSQLLKDLEAETGQATGFKQTGSVSIANNPERFEELLRGASMARCFGVEVEVISPEEVKALWNFVNIDDLVGAIFLPGDGQTNPTDTTQAFAKGAKMRGAKIFEDVKVTGIQQQGGRVTGINTPYGDIQAEVVVNCAGMWAREIGKWAGVNIPLHAAEHFYVITEPVEGLKSGLPTLRDPGGYTYYKEEVGSIMAGFFEPKAKPWGRGGESIPEDFAFGTFNEDWEHLEPAFEKVLHRMPIVGEKGIKTFLNGPESFTPDDRYQLGESPELKNFYVAAGFNSIGIQSSGGAGKMLAEWIKLGHAPADLWDVDIRRNMPFQQNRRYLEQRTTETLGLLYAMHWPYFQVSSSRNVRKSPLHDRLKAANACFGETAGWERPNWFAPAGVEPVYRYSYKRQNWFDYSASEHRAVRENVGIFDQSHFSKFLLQGRDALKILNYICGNQLDVPIGKIVYTQMLNARGGIEADVTITRTGKNSFYIVDGAALQVRTAAFIRQHITEDDHAFLTDVTTAYSMITVMGPNSRKLLAKLTDADLYNEAFPFGTSQEIDFAYAKLRASRITYVGELGWELHMTSDFAQHVYDALIDEGKVFDLKPCGYHALNSLRLEKAYRHWGHDIADEDTPIEAGLSFVVDFNKDDFLGKAILESQKTKPLTKRLVQFALEDPEPLLYHNEPIVRDGHIVGYLTSGMYGHTLGCALGMGYVKHPDGVNKEFLEGGRFEIEVAGKRISAKPSLRPFYDPKSERIRL
ncbi:MAG: FAD-dependent oxidoreductase [Deinococcales bacterium]